MSKTRSINLITLKTSPSAQRPGASPWLFPSRALRATIYRAGQAPARTYAKITPASCTRLVAVAGDQRHRVALHLEPHHLLVLILPYTAAASQGE